MPPDLTGLFPPCRPRVGRRSDDQFCVYIADLPVLPDSHDSIAPIASPTASLRRLPRFARRARLREGNLDGDGHPVVSDLFEALPASAARPSSLVLREHRRYERSMPTARAHAASSRHRALPSPRPCQSSITSIAASAATGDSSERKKAPPRRPPLVFVDRQQRFVIAWSTPSR